MTCNMAACYRKQPMEDKSYPVDFKAGRSFGEPQESAPQILPEKFPIGQRVTLPGHFLEPVTLEGIRFIGSGYECRVRLADGTPDEAILSLEEGAALTRQAVVTPSVVHPADAEKLRLLVESARIRLAYAHDRQFAVSLSSIRTLPHQIEAVYTAEHRFLPPQKERDHDSAPEG